MKYIQLTVKNNSTSVATTTHRMICCMNKQSFLCVSGCIAIKFVINFTIIAAATEKVQVKFKFTYRL